MDMCVRACLPRCMSEDNLWELVLAFHPLVCQLSCKYPLPTESFRQLVRIEIFRKFRIVLSSYLHWVDKAGEQQQCIIQKSRKCQLLGEKVLCVSRGPVNLLVWSWTKSWGMFQHVPSIPELSIPSTASRKSDPALRLCLPMSLFRYAAVSLWDKWQWT